MKRLLLLVPLLVLLAPAPTWGQASHRAGVVVRFGDGSVQTSCVSFATETISGIELLRGSGLDVIAQTAGNNAAVCKIGGDGCNYPAESCLACKFGAGGQGQYWAYWQLGAGAWRYGQLGAGMTRVRDGDVDGWAYGAGNVQTGAQPPVVTYDEICPTAPAPEPTPEPTPTPVPPTPRPTLQPTVPPTVPPTARPTRAATPTPTAAPTEAIIAVAPSPTPEPATSTPQPTATPQLPPATATPQLPTTTQAPAATPVPATAAPLPTQDAAGAAPAATPLAATPPTSAAGYAIFAAMLVAIVAAIGLALRRRRV